MFIVIYYCVVWKRSWVNCSTHASFLIPTEIWAVCAHLCSLSLLQTIFKCPTLFLSGMHGALSPSLHFEAQNYLTVTRVYSQWICYYHHAQTHKELMCLIYLFTMGSQGHRCAVDERELFFSIEVEIPQVFCQKDTSGFFVIFILLWWSKSLSWE